MELNYKKIGEGKALIILHGLFGSLDNWMTLAKAWSETYEVWLVDQRNHGQSPHSDAFSYQLMAEDLKQFIQQHQIHDPIILGHSMGGKTAMEFAVNNAIMLSKLIVVDIAPVKYEVHHYAILDALEQIDLDKISSRKEADQLLTEKIKEVGTRQFLLKNLYWKEKNQLAWRFNLNVLRREIIPISEWSISEGQYNGSCLFVKGQQSSYILPEHGAEISAKFPNYELREIQGAGHWVHAESPKMFYDVVSSFMKD